MAAKKKPSAKQLAARAKFTAIMKSGGFGNKRVHGKIKSNIKKLDKQIAKFSRKNFATKHHNKPKFSKQALINRAAVEGLRQTSKELAIIMRAIRDPKVKSITLHKK